MDRLEQILNQGGGEPDEIKAIYEACKSYWYNQKYPDFSDPIMKSLSELLEYDIAKQAIALVRLD